MLYFLLDAVTQQSICLHIVPDLQCFIMLVVKYPLAYNSQTYWCGCSYNVIINYNLLKARRLELEIYMLRCSKYCNDVITFLSTSVRVWVFFLILEQLELKGGMFYLFYMLIFYCFYALLSYIYFLVLHSYTISIISI